VAGDKTALLTVFFSNEALFIMKGASDLYLDGTFKVNLLLILETLNLVKYTTKRLPRKLFHFFALPTLNLSLFLANYYYLLHGRLSLESIHLTTDYWSPQKLNCMFIISLFRLFPCHISKSSSSRRTRRAKHQSPSCLHFCQRRYIYFL
jgi:succinate dehydrogenase hydrophobic anchor subunit